MGSIQGVQGDIRQKVRIHLYSRYGVLSIRILVQSEATRIATLIGEREPNGVTALFNNAGVLKGNFERPASSPSNPPNAQAFVDTLFHSVSQDDFDDVYRTNAVGPYWLTFAFLPLLEKWKSSPGGTKFVPQVIMTSSMNGWTKVYEIGLQCHAY
jgi:NAD(P)-dependent dehydrogenase (short-subunit alcohol dehydrogenase family)